MEFNQEYEYFGVDKRDLLAFFQGDAVKDGDRNNFRYEYWNQSYRI